VHQERIPDPGLEIPDFGERPIPDEEGFTSSAARPKHPDITNLEVDAMPPAARLQYGFPSSGLT